MTSSTGILFKLYICQKRKPTEHATRVILPKHCFMYPQNIHIPSPHASHRAPRSGPKFL